MNAMDKALAWIIISPIGMKDGVKDIGNNYPFIDVLFLSFFGHLRTII